MKQTLACAITLALLAGAARADFSGPYAQENWTLETNGGDGAAAGNAEQLVLVGSNTNSRIFTSYTIKAPGDGMFTFDWLYTCDDEYERLDTAGYSIAGVVTLLAEADGESGSVSVSVLAGDVIGFWVDTADGMDQPGRIKITNFSGPAASGAPTGACCFIQPGCMDGIFEDECFRRGGTYMGDGTTCADVDCGFETQNLRIVLEGDNVYLSPLAGCSASDPVLAYNSQDDEFLVVWQESSLASNTSVAAQRFTPTGTPVGDLLTIVLTAGWQIVPHVAYNSVDNEYLIDWRWQGASGPTFNSLRGKRFNADLTPVDAVYQLTTEGIGFESSLVHNPIDNQYFTTARRYNPEPGGVFGCRIAGQTVLDPDIELDTTQGFAFGFPAPNGEVAHNSLDNQYLATYAVQAYPTWSAFNVRGRLIGDDGMPIGDPFEINFAPNFRTFYHAATVQFDANAGRYLVVYGDTRQMPIRGQFVCRDGRLMGYPFEISAPVPDTEVPPHLAFDPINNVYLVAWCDSPIDTPTNVNAQLVGADGTPLGQPMVLSTTAYHEPCVQANTTGGGFLVAWRDYRNPGTIDVYGQFIGVESWCPGDLNGDNVVNLSDLAQLLSNYGVSGGATYEMGDLDGDGNIRLDDLAALLALYGTTCS